MPKIIAVDFDGTLFEDKWPEIGEPIWNNINWCKARKLDYNDILVLWTCRTDKRLQEAINACEKVGLYFDYVNDNVPDLTNTFGSDSRKVGADIYIDDKAINSRDLTQLEIK